MPFLPVYIETAWHDPCLYGSVFVAKNPKKVEIRQGPSIWEAGMFKRAILTAGVVLSTCLILSGMSWAQQVECKPLCFLTASSSNNGNFTVNDHQGQGQRRADDVAGEHGSEGRDNARQKQDAHRARGASSASALSSPTRSQPLPGFNPSKMDPRMIPPTCSQC